MSPLELEALESRKRAFQTLVERVRNEFLEMPGLRLTMPQAARLWGAWTSRRARPSWRR